MALRSRLLFAAVCLGLLTAVGPLKPGHAQQQGYGQTLDGVSGGGAASLGAGSGSGKGGSVLDAVNPIDLMNKIQRSQSLNDATPPGDAIDQALREYQSQPSASGAAATVKSP